MTENILEKLFEHNNWANEQIIPVCSALSDEQLDAEPQSATQGSIGSTLSHLVSAQRGYLALLTLPVEERPTTPLAYAELQESARISATEHREQINSMLSALGRTPPDLDGWSFGEATNALIPISK